MTSDNEIELTRLGTGKECAFRPSHAIEGSCTKTDNTCLCPTDVSESCRCLLTQSHGLRTSFVHPSHQTRLVGYIRTGFDDADAARQLDLIEKYCSEHDYCLTNIFVDQGKPSFGLSRALQELRNAQGLIALDLSRFVDDTGDRLRDLRPFVHHFFCNPNKHLITLNEGIDTGTIAGQMSAVEVLKQRHDEL